MKNFPFNFSAQIRNPDKQRQILFFLVYATKHENIKCWTCGPTQEGPEEKGWCKDQNEQGNLTTCEATQKSCAVGLISK